jgi:hypothetical protein
VIETDIFNFVVAGILSQHDNKQILYPAADFLRKHLPAEINYKIYDKELLMIMRAFKE